MAQPELKAGIKVLITNSQGRGGGKYLGLTAITINQYQYQGTWLLDIDKGGYWWPNEYLQVVCCMAKGCMWHKKEEKQ